VPGYPIRTPSDQRSAGSSPRHIAASRVLHRPLMPRHPPCALKHLRKTHKNQNKITPDRHTPPPHARHTPTRTAHGGAPARMLATAIHESNTAPRHRNRAATHPPRTNRKGHPPRNNTGGQLRCCLRTQQCAGDQARCRTPGNPRPLTGGNPRTLTAPDAPRAHGTPRTRDNTP
jgi:hypothetical protein